MTNLFLISGCGRSGTTWAHRLFTELGYRTRHENQFSPVKAGPLRVPESSWLAVPFLDDLPTRVRVLRVMRDPYEVARSAAERPFLGDLKHPYGAFVHRHRPDITAPGDRLGRAIRWAALWDEPMQQRGDELLRVESGVLHVLKAVQFATGRSPEAQSVKRAMTKLGTRVNHNSPALRAGGPTREDIDAHPDGHLIRERAEKFWYSS